MRQFALGEMKIFLSTMTMSIFESEYNRLTRIRDELIEDNLALTNASFGFLHKGKFITNREAKTIPVAQRKPVDPSLYERADQFISEKEETDRDFTRVVNVLTNQLSLCRTAQDIRDALPDVFATFHPDLASLQRTREPGWHVKGKTFPQISFDEVIYSLRFYLTSKVLS